MADAVAEMAIGLQDSWDLPFNFLFLLSSFLPVYHVHSRHNNDTITGCYDITEPVFDYIIRSAVSP